MSKINELKELEEKNKDRDCTKCICYPKCKEYLEEENEDRKYMIKIFCDEYNEIPIEIESQKHDSGMRPKFEVKITTVLEIQDQVVLKYIETTIKNVFKIETKDNELLITFDNGIEELTYYYKLNEIIEFKIKNRD